MEIRNFDIIKLITLLVLGVSIISCRNIEDKKMGGNENKPVKVEVVLSNGKYQLIRDGKPYYVSGAGAEYEKIQILAENGANSCRTWNTKMPHYTAKEYLDTAHYYNLTVTMGLDLKKERHGFDYNDSVAVKKQFEYIKQEVLKYKDHPALLVWGIGNELNLNYTNPKVWDAVNDISKMIHELDLNHLTTTMLAGINKTDVDYITDRCPDVDFLSIQLYGALEELQDRIVASGYNGPYLVTEWGATGHWEVEKTTWNAPIEETSNQKAKSFSYRYKNVIEADSINCLGSYVFYWGQKQERTPTWYGLFTEKGKPTESVDAMFKIWNGIWPDNRAPQLDSLLINGMSAFDNVMLEKSKKYTAEVYVHNYEGDSLLYKWEVLLESTDLGVGGDYENKPEEYKGLITQHNNNIIGLKAPDLSGAYRLFVYVTDEQQKVATANIPFYVK